VGVSTDGILFFGIVFDDETETETEFLFLESKGSIKIDTHCSGEYPMYFLTIKGYHHTAYRGCPQEIQSFDRPSDGDIEELRHYCTVNNLPYTEPKWWLVSYWG